MKKPRSRRRSRSAQIPDALDQALDRCHNIATLARLLWASGHHRRAEPLAADLATDTGKLILRELRQLETLLPSLQHSKASAPS